MKKQWALLTVLSFFWVTTSVWAGSGLNGTPVGNETPDTGTFTNLEATTQFKLGADIATSFDGIDSKKVKSSATDSTSGFLTDELQGGTNVTVSEIDVAGDKKISVSVADKLNAKGDMLTHDGSNETSLPVGTSGQVLTADPASASGVKWADTSRDDSDGVDITFGREVVYDPGTGPVPSLDINGTDLFIGANDPTVNVGGIPASVLSKTTISGSQKQVVLKLPGGLSAGHYKVRLDNTQGVSNFYLPLDDTFFDGSTWSEATSAAAWSAQSTGTYSFPVFDNKMWFIGGGSVSDVWYSTDGITWTEATSNAAFPARHGFTSLVFDNKMWLIGGTDGSYKNDVWYSTDGITWAQATAAAAFSARHVHSSVVFNNKMWVIGGEDGSIKNDVWSSTDGVTWTQATSAAAFPARLTQTSVVFDNKMWVMGGAFAGVRKNDVWHSTDGINWTQATANAGWAGRVHHTSAVYNDKMWVMGGDAPTLLNDVWYSSDGANWTQATASAGWSGRNEPASVVFNNKIWIMGGYDGSAKNDVWHTSD